jgi:ketosteroid isomerase-like protein
MKKFSIFALLIILLNASFAQKNTEADVLYIRTARTASNEAIAKKDVAGVAKYWKEDYVEISSDGSLISGKENVVADWKNMFAKDSSIRFERHFRNVEFARGGGPIAMETGILVYTSPYTYQGFYTAMWRKINGVWVTQIENFVSILYN